MNGPLVILCLMLTLPSERPTDVSIRFLVSQLAQAPQAAPLNPQDAEQQRRQNTVTIGVLILVGVAAIGLLLIAGALIWGAKVRRMVRPGDVEPTRLDNLWYLRKGKPTVGETGNSPDDEPPSDPPSRPRISDSDDTRS